MSLIFYYSPMSTASTVHWTIEELGVPYEAVKVNLQDPKEKVEKLGKVNPNLKVPVLVHDGVAIFESAAIQMYLGETFGVEKGLYPAPGPKRGEAMKWIVWCNVTLGEALARLLRNSSERFPKDQHNAKQAEGAKADLARLLGIAEDAIADRPFLLGDSIGVADFHLASSMHYATFCGVDLSPYPKLAAWTTSCTSRPIYRKLMPGMG